MLTARHREGGGIHPGGVGCVVTTLVGSDASAHVWEMRLWHALVEEAPGVVWIL